MTNFSALCQFCFWKFVTERAVIYSEPLTLTKQLCLCFLLLVFCFVMLIWCYKLAYDYTISDCLRCFGAKPLSTGRTYLVKEHSYDINGLNEAFIVFQNHHISVFLPYFFFLCFWKLSIWSKNLIWGDPSHRPLAGPVQSGFSPPKLAP